MTTATRSGITAVVTVAGLLAIGAVLGLIADPLLRFGVAAPPPQDATVWTARIVLVLALAWIVIGMLAARTSLVERPGAAAARASWIASTRPWRARESVLGVLAIDRFLTIAVPIALLVGTRVLEASFAAWIDVSAILAGWLVFAAVVRLLIGGRSPWPAIVAMGGAIALYSILALAAISVAGPVAWWTALAESAPLRTAAVAVGFAAASWVFVAGGWALSSQFGVRRATGMIIAGLGAGVAVAAAIIAGAGHGPSAPLQVPEPTPWIVAAVATLVAASGLGIALAWPRRG